MDKKEEIIHLSGVAKYYMMGDNIVKAVDDMDISIKKGDFVAVMGPSGSGKSTAMNLIGSLDMPTKGHIFLEGEDISLLEESDLAQVRGRNIGFIFQQFNLISTLTVKENVMLPMTLQGYDMEEREERVKHLLDKMELTDRADHYPNQISGGQQQRVAIARSLANNPKIILADEPTGALDSKSSKEIMELLKQLNKQGKTIIVITHDSTVANQTKREIILKDGKIITDKKR